MTDAEKLAELKNAISPDEESDEVLAYLLKLASEDILNRMYPWGYAEGYTVPAYYEYAQIELAVEYFTKRGAEGQSGHSENGISRTWPEKSRILAKIPQHCGSVISNA